jgi:hypothetical protein
MSVGQGSGNGAAAQATPATVAAGPYDSGDATEQLTHGLVDFGSLLVPVPPNATARAQHRPPERWPGVHIEAPVGYLRLHVLAAPRSGSLWGQLSLDIFGSLDGRDTRVSREQGRWGVEITCTSAESVTRFVGVDGPRWTLYGVATGPVELAAEQASALRAIMRGTVVVRGEGPFPVSSALPLASPAETGPSDETAGSDEAGLDVPAPGEPATARARPRRTALATQDATKPAQQAPARATAPPRPPRAGRPEPAAYAPSPRPPATARPAGSIPRQPRSIGRLTRQADPPTEPIRLPRAAPRQDDTRRRLQQRLIVLEAVVAALHRYRELVPLIANAENRIDATAAIRVYLDVGEASARAILELPWHQLTAACRRAITSERDELRSYLYAADWNWS